jgi:8-oxo-dGTP pyrophosphatase MutT (NUDIX family)
VATEYGETFEECAVREVKEETGLDVEMRFLSVEATLQIAVVINIFIKAKVTGGTMKLGDEPVLAGVEFAGLEELPR